MKRKEYLNKTKELKELKLIIIEFENNPMYTNPFDLQIPMFYWNLSMLKQYYKLRKDLKKVKIIENYKSDLSLPINAWILHKYIFEIVFIIVHIFIIIIYFMETPIFRGKLSFYLVFFFISYAILGYKLIEFSHNIFYHIQDIKKVLDDNTKIIKLKNMNIRKKK